MRKLWTAIGLLIAVALTQGFLVFGLATGTVHAAGGQDDCNGIVWRGCN